MKFMGRHFSSSLWPTFKAVGITYFKAKKYSSNGYFIFLWLSELEHFSVGWLLGHQDKWMPLVKQNNLKGAEKLDKVMLFCW